MCYCGFKRKILFIQWKSRKREGYILVRRRWGTQFLISKWVIIGRGLLAKQTMMEEMVKNICYMIRDAKYI